MASELIQELEKFGDVREGGAILYRDESGYHMREARNLFGRHRHDLPIDTSAERLEAHWMGFVGNVRAC